MYFRWARPRIDSVPHAVTSSRFSWLCLACCGAASAGPGLILGVADDDLKWTEDTKGVVLGQQDVGFKAVRITLRWKTGQTQLDDEGRTYVRRAQAAAKLGQRVVIAVFGDASSPPVAPDARTAYCSFVVDALSRAKNVNDVVIWNEANSALFWRPQQGAPAAYEALLAECYDTLHKFRRTVDVISSTSPHEDPGRFLRGVGDAYRASGRTLPIFDTLGHNAYPETTRELPYAAHTNASLDEGDYLRLMGVLTLAFDGTAQPIPGNGTIETPATGNGRNAQPALSWPVTIWYLEDGFETVVASDRRASYTGREPNRQLVQPVADEAARRGLGRPGEPAEGRDRARLLPACGRRVLQLPARRRGRPRRLAVGAALGRRSRRSRRTSRPKRCWPALPPRPSTAGASRSLRPDRGSRPP